MDFHESICRFGSFTRFLFALTKTKRLRLFHQMHQRLFSEWVYIIIHIDLADFKDEKESIHKIPLQYAVDIETFTEEQRWTSSLWNRQHSNKPSQIFPNPDD
jgi:hypothetical protein